MPFECPTGGSSPLAGLVASKSRCSTSMATARRFCASGPFAGPVFVSRSTNYLLTSGMKYVDVQLLTGQHLYVAVDVRCKVADIFDCVCAHIGTQMPRLFGLCVRIENEYRFLELSQKFSKCTPKNWSKSGGSGTDMLGQPSVILYLRVHTYVDAVRIISCPIALLHYYMQLRENLRVYWSPEWVREEQCYEATALALQADFGDYNENTAAGTVYFSPELYFPSWVVEYRGVHFLRRHTPTVHQDCQGMDPQEARYRFCEELSTGLSAVNVHLYRLKRTKSEQFDSILLGIGPTGIDVFEPKQDNPRALLGSFQWARISKLSFDRRKFLICSVDGRKLTFYTSSDQKSRYLLHFCRMFHQNLMKLHIDIGSLGNGNYCQDGGGGDGKIAQKQCSIYGVIDGTTAISNGETLIQSSDGKITSNGCDKIFPNLSNATGQRVSLVSDASSNTTSGIVSDKQQAPDDSENDNGELCHRQDRLNIPVNARSLSDPDLLEFDLSANGKVPLVHSDSARSEVSFVSRQTYADEEEASSTDGSGEVAEFCSTSQAVCSCADSVAADTTDRNNTKLKTASNGNSSNVEPVHCAVKNTAQIQHPILPSALATLEEKLRRCQLRTREQLALNVKNSLVDISDIRRRTLFNNADCQPTADRNCNLAQRAYMNWIPTGGMGSNGMELASASAGSCQDASCCAQPKQQQPQQQQQQQQCTTASVNYPMMDSRYQRRMAPVNAGPMITSSASECLQSVSLSNLPSHALSSAYGSTPLHVDNSNSSLPNYEQAIRQKAERQHGKRWTTITCVDPFVLNQATSGISVQCKWNDNNNNNNNNEQNEYLRQRNDQLRQPLQQAQSEPGLGLDARLSSSIGSCAMSDENCRRPYKKYDIFSNDSFYRERSLSAYLSGPTTTTTTTTAECDLAAYTPAAYVNHHHQQQQQQQQQQQYKSTVPCSYAECKELNSSASSGGGCSSHFLHGSAIVSRTQSLQDSTSSYRHGGALGSGREISFSRLRAKHAVNLGLGQAVSISSSELLPSTIANRYQDSGCSSTSTHYCDACQEEHCEMPAIDLDRVKSMIQAQAADLPLIRALCSDQSLHSSSANCCSISELDSTGSSAAGQWSVPVSRRLSMAGNLDDDITGEYCCQEATTADQQAAVLQFGTFEPPITGRPLSWHESFVQQQKKHRHLQLQKPPPTPPPQTTKAAETVEVASASVSDCGSVSSLLQCQFLMPPPPPYHGDTSSSSSSCHLSLQKLHENSINDCYAGASSTAQMHVSLAPASLQSVVR